MSEPLAPVDLVLVWHHHQPDYRDPRDGRALLPWTRLHATKDYLDMALHVERHPGLRVTFNLVPSLIDQLEAIASGEPDLLFDLLARPVDSLTPEERARVAARCVQAPVHGYERWPAYRALRGAAEGPNPPDEARLLALEIWFLLAWLDPMFLTEPEASEALAAAPGPGHAIRTGSAQAGWSEAHRDALLALHRRLAAAVLPAYRALADGGQVELCTSPYDHPILPLVIDTTSARRARADLPLPAERLNASDDARRHIERARDRHAQVFGAVPAGLWPSEGSVSPEAVAIAARCGVRWMASDEGVLWASLPESERRRSALYRPWRAGADGAETALFFRDHELSDRIGFVYQRWEPREAAADFVSRLRKIGREHGGDRPPVVTVILDGENCWEYYREDGFAFLNALYEALEGASEIRTRTPSQVLEERGPEAALRSLHSGSWIDADFHIWIGHPEKNRAWDLLARARRALLEAGVTPEAAPQAWRALYRAEGSDWFWWFGDDHPSSDLPVFDHLFRELLRTVYESAGLPAPPSLKLAIAHGVRGGDGDQPPIGLIHPRVDGRLTTFYEWHGAGRSVLGPGGTAMHRGAGGMRALFHGFDLERLYLRLDFAGPGPPGREFALAIELVEPRPARLLVRGLVPGSPAVVWDEEPRAGEPVPGAGCRIDRVLELEIPFSALGLAAGEKVRLLIQARRGGKPVETYPGEDGLEFAVPGPDFEATMWSA